MSDNEALKQRVKKLEDDLCVVRHTAAELIRHVAHPPAARTGAGLQHPSAQFALDTHQAWLNATVSAPNRRKTEQLLGQLHFGSRGQLRPIAPHSDAAIPQPAAASPPSQPSFVQPGEALLPPHVQAALRQFGSVLASESPQAEVARSLPQRKPSFAVQNPVIFGKLGQLVDQLQLLDSKLLVNSPTGHYVVEALARDCWAQALQLVLAMEQEVNA